MPRVVFDSQVFAEQARGGVSRYFINLAVELERATSWRPLLAPGWNVHGDFPEQIEISGPSIQVGPMRGFRLRRQVNRLLMRARQPRDDAATVYHPTWYHVPTIRAWSHLPTVITIHDLIPEVWPEVTDARQLADRATAIRAARAITCVSVATLEDLTREFPEVASRARVARPGVPRLPVGKAAASPDSFVIHVGKRGSYKDFETVLRGVARVSGLSLVAVGGGPPTDAESLLAEELGISNRLDFRPRVDDQELANLMAAALALVSASRIEGFGLPPIEAASQGTASVLSDIPVYREIHEGWANFFPAGDHVALAEALDATARGDHPSLPRPEELVARFSWEQTVSETAAAYEFALS